MAFFDTHTHLDYLQQFSGEPLSQLLANALAADVQKILIVAVKESDFATIQAMVEAFPQQLRYGLGLHPLYIKAHQMEDLERLEEALSKCDSRCTALAEIGLERAIADLLSDELWQKQQYFLERQLYLAKQYRLSVSLHSRKSHDQLLTFLKRADLPQGGVLHGFSGSYEQAKRFVDLGYKIGVGGTITYARANKTRQAIAKLPLEALVLETDSPDMPVFGFQGQPNRPERIVQTFEALCDLRSEGAEEIREMLWQNSLNLFA